MSDQLGMSFSRVEGELSDLTRMQGVVVYADHIPAAEKVRARLAERGLLGDLEVLDLEPVGSSRQYLLGSAVVLSTLLNREGIPHIAVFPTSIHWVERSEAEE